MLLTEIHGFEEAIPWFLRYRIIMDATTHQTDRVAGGAGEGDGVFVSADVAPDAREASPEAGRCISTATSTPAPRACPPRGA